jgi:O-methyltransferase
VSIVAPLLDRYPIISDQISRQELVVILSELEKKCQSELKAVVEFGCYAGTTSLFIRRVLDACNSQAVFHAYDSFEGLPEKVRQDASPVGEQFVAGELSVSKKTFLHNFQRAGLKPPVVHKGWFNAVADEAVPREIGLAFLDGDYYESIHDSLRAIEHKLAPGAVIIVDDYANEALPGAAEAVDEWCARKGFSVNKITASLAIIYN